MTYSLYPVPLHADILRINAGIWLSASSKLLEKVCSCTSDFGEQVWYSCVHVFACVLNVWDTLCNCSMLLLVGSFCSHQVPKHVWRTPIHIHPSIHPSILNYQLECNPGSEPSVLSLRNCFNLSRQFPCRTLWYTVMSTHFNLTILLHYSGK